MDYICKQCGKRYKVSAEIIKCDCGAALWLDYQGVFKKSDIIQQDFSMWRYSKAYPVSKEDAQITYGEGLTPLTKIVFENYPILVKQDNLMPTGSFKDRGVVMVINFLNNLGIKKIAEDSSGNGGSSYAGYSALGNLDLKVYIPAGTSEGKVAQVNLYGAQLIEVEGTRADVADAAMESKHDRVYVGHNWHPLFIQGMKSLAYELWEQNNFTAPDNVICVAGNGSMIAGVYTGFEELKNSGEVTKIPRIFGIQSDGCNPFFRDFIGKSLDFDLTPSIAEGIRIKKSTRHDAVMSFIKNTDGAFVSVNEREIREALILSGKHGLYIEPTSATGFAGLKRLIESNIIKQDETTVIIVSGNGLKATSKIIDIVKKESL